MLGDTIAAISTAMGEAGIGIVRMTGTDSLYYLKKIFLPKDPERFAQEGTYKLYLGQIVDPTNGELIDEVLVSLMLQPHSFTGEDVVEINCHGGMIAQRSIMSLLLRQGVRLAEAGEFSKRAFINGRLDLVQAEAVIDLIRAKTSLSASAALEQLRGKLSGEVAKARNLLLEILAEIEAGIDFPEEDLEVAGVEKISNNLRQVSSILTGLLSSSQRGRILRDGVNTAIVGHPNVGKSSLLNALLREDRAIVTDVPGTTRDVLEEYISVKGVPLKLIDTAGIRQTDDLVEKLGVERALKVLTKADLVLFVIEAGRALVFEELEIIKGISPEKLIVVVNKIDMASNFKLDVDAPVFYVSALHKVGIEELEDGIIQLVLGQEISGTPVISNIRHISALERCLDKVHSAIELLTSEVPLDLISIDIRGAWELLGEVNGDTISEDLLDEIFSRFCIGK